MEKNLAQLIDFAAIFVALPLWLKSRFARRPKRGPLACFGSLLWLLSPLPPGTSYNNNNNNNIGLLWSSLAEFRARFSGRQSRWARLNVRSGFLNATLALRATLLSECQLLWPERSFELNCSRTAAGGLLLELDCIWFPVN